jgi:UDP-glucuronate 4-epimerase
LEDAPVILVTGAAGFIGFHASRALLARGQEVVALDNLNDYYDPRLKRARLAILQRDPHFHFEPLDLCDLGGLSALFERFPVRRIVHLAAQAGVRYSIDNPFAYQKSNNEGFLNIIELARRRKVENFVYASSSSVYGGNTKLPFAESDPVDTPVSLYAATKRSNELVAHCYSHLFGLPSSGLRFFTVYGPWGRPDMALCIFTKSILEGRPLDVYNHGQMVRNFTYVDDAVQGVLCTLDSPAPYELYNVGNDRAETLLDFIAAIERAVGRVAVKNLLPLQPGDVPRTVADISKLRRLGFEPSTGISIGIGNFVSWYREYFKA